MAIDPRGLSREAAAAYCGCTVEDFETWVRDGIVCRQIPGTTKWDRQAIDDSLDRFRSPTPRGMSRENAAVYCGCETPRAFDEWVRKKIVPRPIPGTTKWDRRAIDRALDRHLPDASANSDPLEQWLATSAFDKWKASQDQERDPYTEAVERAGRLHKNRRKK